MNSLQLHCSVHFFRPNLCLRYSTTIFTSRFSHFPGKINIRESLRVRAKANSLRSLAQSETKEECLAEIEERSPFDINLAVILAGLPSSPMLHLQKISGSERLMHLGVILVTFLRNE